jgi:xylulose-5-phosphate/fructose-6-phosphate phosphoketolase
MNRAITNWDLDATYVIGPGHGGPGIVANAYLEGTYSEVYPQISQDAEGMARLFRQFSFPGGIPSHVAPETPGSIHEGGAAQDPKRPDVSTPTTRQNSQLCTASTAAG